GRTETDRDTSLTPRQNGHHDEGGSHHQKTRGAPVRLRLTSEKLRDRCDDDVGRDAEEADGDEPDGPPLRPFVRLGIGALAAEPPRDDEGGGYFDDRIQPEAQKR